MISVITPAHNEEAFIADCLQSVLTAAENVDVPVEHIVVLNRCTDRTEEIAASMNARVVVEDARCLSRIRNAGASAAQGDVLVTIDADSRMTENMLHEVWSRLHSGKFIGGGVRILPERWSLGIICSVLMIFPLLIRNGVSAGMFWCFKRDFDAIGGFNEELLSIEDLDFGNRLKRLGRQQGKKYGTIRSATITTSCRKFDQFGDWYFVRRPLVMWNIIRGEQSAVDEFYYEFEHHARKE